MTIPQPCLNLDFANSRGFIDPRLTFSRASVGTFIGQNGLLQSAASGVPRIAYDPVTLVCLGLLVEEQRTNLLIYSNTLPNGAWGKSGATVSTGSSAKPDGSASAATVITSNATTVQVVVQTITGTGGVATTSSLHLKYGSWRYVQVACDDGAGNGCFVNVDLQNLTIGTPTAMGTGSGAAGTITLLQNGWCRVSATATFASATKRCVFAFANSLTSGFAPSVTGDGIKYAYIDSGQTETGSFPTSPIVTTSATVTRAADNATLLLSMIPGLDPFQGTIAAQYISLGFSSYNGIAVLGDSSVARVGLFYRDSTHLEAGLNVGNADVMQLELTQASFNAENKAAFSYKSGAFAAVINGGAALTSSYATYTAPNTTLFVGQLGSGSGALNGTLARLAIFPAAVPAADLQLITV